MAPRALFDELLEWLARHQGIDQAAIECLCGPLQRLQRDAAVGFRFLDGEYARLADLQALGELLGCHSEGFSDGPEPAFGRTTQVIQVLQ